MKMVIMKIEVTFLLIEEKKNNSKGYITVWLHIYININDKELIIMKKSEVKELF